MDIFNEFMAAHGSTILYTVVTSIAGYLGIVLKNLYEKTATTKMKKDVINTCVQAVEQIYKDLHGKEKLKQRRWKSFFSCKNCIKRYDKGIINTRDH